MTMCLTLFSVDNGIGQGETSLMLLYLIYSYGLVAIPNCVNEDGGAYVDDNFFLATVDSFKQSDITLNRMLNRADEWFIAHNSQAEITKFKCLQFPCPHVFVPRLPSPRLGLAMSLKV